MDFKKLFRKDDKAVSPVIGVILMVAITVILAAAIGSSVFSHGAAQAAPQANLDIKPISAYVTTGTSTDPTIKIEHLGGDQINFDESTTKILASVDGANSVQVYFDPQNGADSTLTIGDITTFEIVNAASSGSAVTTILPSTTVNLKFIDIKSGQIFCDRNIVF